MKSKFLFQLFKSKFNQSIKLFRFFFFNFYKYIFIQIFLFRYFGKEPPMAEIAKWGSFTQMIWNQTTHFGIGCSIQRILDEGEVTLNVATVVTFSPRGNVHCHFKYNAMPFQWSDLYYELMTKPRVPAPECPQVGGDLFVMIEFIK